MFNLSAKCNESQALCLLFLCCVVSASLFRALYHTNLFGARRPLLLASRYNVKKTSSASLLTELAVAYVLVGYRQSQDHVLPITDVEPLELVPLCPTRGPRAACDPVEGFARPSLGFRCSKRSLYIDNLSFYFNNREFDIFDAVSLQYHFITSVTVSVKIRTLSVH